MIRTKIARILSPTRVVLAAGAEQGVREWKSTGRRVTQIRLRGRSWKISHREYVPQDHDEQQLWEEEESAGKRPPSPPNCHESR